MKSTIIISLFLSLLLMAIITNKNIKESAQTGNIFLIQDDTSFVNRHIKVDSFNLTILPPSSGIQFYKDGIIYLSSSKLEENMLPEYLSFGKTDTRYAILNDTILENPRIFSPSLSFTYPCEAITFSSDFNTMYFTKYSKADGTEKIYQAKFILGIGNQGGWSTDDNPMSFCSDQSIYTHPTLSADGKMMIFASNRPGSLGGLDLFVVYNDEGSWSVPENLGNAINSIYNEMYPCLDSKDNLFFSSDGMTDYGGYDIFMCKFFKKDWEKPINLSTPINTRYDDIAFTINRKDGKSAFYTVNQKSGKGSVQLYKVTINNHSQNQSLTLSEFFAKHIAPNVSFHALEPVVEAKEPPDSRPPALPENTLITETKPKVKPLDMKVDTFIKEILKDDSIKTKNVNITTPGRVVTKDLIIYRVQLVANVKPKGSYSIVINNKSYNTFEYLYKGFYRTCVGEFSTLSQAGEFQNICRKSGYPQAFVVAFKNNVRSTDAALFK